MMGTPLLVGQLQYDAHTQPLACGYAYHGSLHGPGMLSEAAA